MTTAVRNAEESQRYALASTLHAQATNKSGLEKTRGEFGALGRATEEVSLVTQL